MNVLLVSLACIVYAFPMFRALQDRIPKAIANSLAQKCFQNMEDPECTPPAKEYALTHFMEIKAMSMAQNDKNYRPSGTQGFPATLPLPSLSDGAIEDGIAADEDEAASTATSTALPSGTQRPVRYRPPGFPHLPLM